MSGTLHKDIGNGRYRALAKVDEYHVNFQIYDLWDCENNLSFTPPRENTIFLSGGVKWDGCSNWKFDEQERVMLHGCSREDLVIFGQIMAECWDWAFDLMPQHARPL